MSFMRLGTRTAVINDAGDILLSKRGDFGVWALPGGRVDSGERLLDSAVREVKEETGLEVEIIHAVGIYYQEGRSRINVLYQARPVGGELFASTDETLDNRFFSPDNLPDELFGKFYIDHAYTDTSHLYTVKSSWWELLKLDLKLRLRWLGNLLSGRPEPTFVKFQVNAVGVIWHEGDVYTQNGNLPSITSDGSKSLWQALSDNLNTRISWQWVGVSAETSTNTMNFIFHAHKYLETGQYRTLNQLSPQQQQYAQKLEKVWHIT